MEKEDIGYTGVPLDFTQFQQIMLSDVRRSISSNAADYRPRKYDRDQIRKFMETPESYERQLREVSHYFLTTSPHYRRVMGYFATMLTLDYIVMPVSVMADKITADNAKFRRSYERSVKYMENFNVKHEFGKIIKILLTDGIFFGYERQQGNSSIIQRLPSNFCKITGQNDGTWTFAFNFQYFVKHDKKDKNADRSRILENFPEEFTQLYNDAVNTRQWWQELNVEDGALCFKFDEDVMYSIPPFTGIFEDIMDLEDFKDLQKSKIKLDNYKLLIQRIPMKKDAKNEKDFILTLDSVATFHKNVKSALPEQVGLATTPMELVDFDFEKARTKEDTVGQAERNFFTSAGVSSALFNAEKAGSIGLNRSIEMDAAFMFAILHQIERFFRKRVTQVSDSNAPFKAMFPDLTIYNRNDMFDKYIQAAQFGFSKLLVAAALGISSGDVLALASFENDFLGLDEALVPLQSAHTGASADAGATAGAAGGRPTKPASKVSDSGASTRDGNKNAGRAK